MVVNIEQNQINYLKKTLKVIDLVMFDIDNHEKVYFRSWLLKQNNLK